MVFPIGHLAQVDCPVQVITAHTAAQRPTEEERIPSGVCRRKQHTLFSTSQAATKRSEDGSGGGGDLTLE